MQWVLIFSTYNTGLVQNVEEGLSVVAHDVMDKQETRRLAQSFPPDDSLHLDILLPWLMSVSLGGVLASLNITQGPSLSRRNISQAALDRAKPHAYMSLSVDGNFPNLNF